MSGFDIGAAAAVTSVTPTSAEPLRVPDVAMIGLAREFADLYGKYLETPRSFLFFSFLTYFGLIVSRKITLASALAPEPRLYTVLLGESADTRKSTALRMADDFFRTLGTTYEPRVLYGVGSAEGVAAELKDCPTLLLHFDELKAFVDKAKAETSVALPMISTLFERGDYDNRTKKERLSVRGAALSLLAACTVDTYGSMFDQRFFAIGFLNRLWLVVDRASASIPIPKALPLVEVEALRERTRRVLDTIDARYTTNGLQAVAYPLTPEAEAMFSKWYAARTGSIFERRLDTYGHRLMLLLAASSERQVIDHVVCAAVIALLRYQLDARREADPVDAENTIATLEEKIRRLLVRGPLKIRELQRRVHYDRVGIWAWRTALDNLVMAEDVTVDRLAGMVTRVSPVEVVTTSVTTSKTGISVNGHAH